MIEQLPWIEKYRPYLMDDIILDKIIKNKLNQFIVTRDIPNIILTGTSGTGKTSTIRCVGYAIYGKNYNDYVMELNASDERGIKTVQTEMTFFCKSSNTNAFKHKLIILDEADIMMEKAQHQIKILMDMFSDHVRFAFTCNDTSEIIESIQSRCIILHYNKIKPEHISDNLERICTIEKIKFEKTALKYIAELSRGDMRMAVNYLQLASNRYTNICTKNIHNICDTPQPVVIKQIFIHCIKKDLKSALELMIKLKNNGFSGYDIILGMICTIKSDMCNDIDEHIKIFMLEKICKKSYDISKGTDSMLQLTACLAELTQ